MRYLLTGLMLVLLAMPAWSAPQLRVESLEYDFGEVIQGDKVDHTFRFRNVGDEVLIIESVHSSCGCTAALLSSKRIAPGDTGEIKTTFDSKNFRDAIQKTITLQSNDPDNQSVQFRLKGQVREELVMVPARISFGKLAPGDRVEQRVTIKNSSPQTIQLDALRTTNPNLEVSLEETVLAPGEQTALNVIARIPEDTKRLSGYVIIETDYSRVSRLRLSVSASVTR
jgi:hypothetical protein